MKQKWTTLTSHGIQGDKVNFIPGYKKIIVHFVFAVKHNLRHKARLVAGGHLTDPTMEGSYSSVVQHRSLIMCLVAAELNGLKTMVGDVTSAYLEATTTEKVCSRLVQNLENLKGIPSLSTKLCMAYAHLEQAGINDFLTHYDI